MILLRKRKYPVVCVLCCMRSEYEVNIFMVILEKERKKTLWFGDALFRKMKDFQGMVKQSRNDELISSALVIGPE